MLRLYRKSHAWVVDTGSGTEQHLFTRVEIEAMGVTVTVTPPECADTHETVKSWIQFDSAVLIAMLLFPDYGCIHQNTDSIQPPLGFE